MGYTVSSFGRRFARHAAFAAFALTACSSSSGTGPSAEPFTRIGDALVAGALRQTVTVRVAGDTATIRSVVFNVSDAPVTVESRICGLGVEPSIEWAEAARCGGYSMTGPIAPGDSIVQSDRRRLIGAPETVRVQHLVSPSVWVTVKLR